MAATSRLKYAMAHLIGTREIRSTLRRSLAQLSNSEQGRLISWTIPWNRQSLVSFLKQGKGVPRIYWRMANDPIGFAGYGAAAILTASGPQRFRSIERKASRLFDERIVAGENIPQEVCPRLFGGFAFEEDPELRSFWSAFSAATFILPRYQLTRLGKAGWLTVNHLMRADDHIEDLEYLFIDVVSQIERDASNASQANSGTVRAEKSSESDNHIDSNELVDRQDWEKLFGLAMDRIWAGTLRKVVLARARHLSAARPFDPTLALLRLERRYPDCYRFLFEPVSGNAFFGATPELLARVQGRALGTAALAGSIRRGSTPEEDAGLGEKLLNSRKDRREHALVLEAIEAGIRPMVRVLQVEPAPHLRKLSNIQHLETALTAQLKKPMGVLPIVEALHPTPAVGGVPRAAALDLIHRTEPVERGWYAGPMGWLDPRHNGLFTVAIRSAVAVGREARLFAGAGIVEDSEADREWREIDLKFKPLMDALMAEHGDGRSQS